MPDPAYNVMVRVAGGWQGLPKYTRETHKIANGNQNSHLYPILLKREPRNVLDDI